jgi:hypothetical protein
LKGGRRRARCRSDLISSIRGRSRAREGPPGCSDLSRDSRSTARETDVLPRVRTKSTRSLGSAPTQIEAQPPFARGAHALENLLRFFPFSPSCARELVMDGDSGWLGGFGRVPGWDGGGWWWSLQRTSVQASSASERGVLAV